MRPRSRPSTATRRSRSRSSSSRSTGCACARGGSPRFAARTSCRRPRMYYRLTRDRGFLRAETPALAQLVERIARAAVTSGPARGRLVPEPLSTDLEDHNVDSVAGPDRGGRGTARDRPRLELHRLRGARRAGAHARASGSTGALRPAVARASKRLARRLAVRARPADARQRPFDRLTASRDGSYWNLVMPYAFASGWFPAHSPTSRGILRYLLRARRAAPRRAAYLRAHRLRRQRPAPGSLRSTASASRGSSPTTTSPTSSSSASTACSPPG